MRFATTLHVDWNEVVGALSVTRVLVVGDLILDRYIYGRTERTSPEAPVPVVLYDRQHSVAGGAANVARNIRAMGAEVFCLGLVGNDPEGQELRHLLEREAIDCSGILELDGRPTTIKTRIISQNQQMLRLDREEATPLPSSVENEVVAWVRRHGERFDTIVLSDYAKGMLTPTVAQEAIAVAARAGVPLFVDPKGRDYSRYRGAFALTPNAREAAEASGIATDTSEGVVKAARKILRIAECQWVVVTRGAQGVALVSQAVEPLLVPTMAREVFDVTGAGDTFIAFLAMASGAGFPMEIAARIANAAAGIVVGKVGAATVTPQELLAVLDPSTTNRKLVPREQVRELGERLRKLGKRIVFTNGCFDFLHAGHVAMLQQAKQLGDVLVVAINTDETIATLKGAPRPILKQHVRERLLSAIEAVDHIVVFTELTPHALLAELRPDVLVKGKNYRPEEVEGHEIVTSYGGQVVLLDTIESISTRELIARQTRAE